MAAQFKISIPEPCHEQWNEMIDMEKGKFCGSCQKSVIDFTGFSDNDLQDWFIKNQGKSCGRFKPEQLDNLISGKSNYTISKFKPSLIAASLLAFLSFPKLSNANIVKVPYDQTEKKKANFFSTEQVEILSDTLRTIKGHIVDKNDKQPIIGATVYVNNRLAYNSTDQKGNFEIKLPANFEDKDCVLTVSYIGYKNLSSKVDLTNNRRLNLELCISEYVLGGPEIVYVRHSLWRKILYKAKNQLKDINPFYSKGN